MAVEIDIEPIESITGNLEFQRENNIPRGVGPSKVDLQFAIWCYRNVLGRPYSNGMPCAAAARVEGEGERKGDDLFGHWPVPVRIAAANLHAIDDSQDAGAAIRIDLDFFAEHRHLEIWPTLDHHVVPPPSGPSPGRKKHRHAAVVKTTVNGVRYRLPRTLWRYNIQLAGRLCSAAGENAVTKRTWTLAAACLHSLPGDIDPSAACHLSNGQAS